MKSSNNPAGKGYRRKRANFSERRQQGAYVYRAKNEDEMARLRVGLDLDGVVVFEQAEGEPAIQMFGVN